MPKHVIAATDGDPTQLRFFLGYKDDGEFCDVLWTPSPWQARWIDAAEAVIETELLATFCPSCTLHSWPLDTAGTQSGLK